MLKYKIICLYLVLGLLSNKSFAQLHVQGTLHMQGDAELYVSNDMAIVSADGIVENNGTIFIEGNWAVDEMARFNGNPSNLGNRNVVFQNNSINSNVIQEITGDVTGDNAFYNLIIDKQDGQIALGNDVEITGQLQFIQGIIKTDLMADSDQGNDYQHEVLVSNSSPDAITGHTIEMESSSGNYIEGQLTRAVEGLGSYDFPIGVSASFLDGAEPFQISFNSPAPSSTISAFFNANMITNSTETRICDVGDASDYTTPDGTNDLLTIDCHLGSWITTATASAYDYDVTLFPREQLLANCPEAILFYVAKDSIFGDCPDLSDAEGITATGFTQLGTFDIPTVKEITISTSIKEISSNDNRVSMFPNPLNRQEALTLILEGDFLETDVVQIYIYDSLGKNIGKQNIEITGKEQQIRLVDLVETPGLYTLSIRGTTFLFSRTFVVL